MRLTLFILILSTALSSPCLAQVCEEDALQSSLQHLRRLSIDLKGTLPNLNQLEEVINATMVPDSLVDDLLNSDAFIQEMRNYHLQLLWTNILSQRFTPGVWILRKGNAADGTDAYWLRANGRSSRYRGGQIPCKDEPAEFDTEGNILTTPYPGDPTMQQEGYVEVEPWWAPGTTVKVCAFDAQTNLEGANPSNNNPDRVANCSSQVVETCGCGENLQWCHANNPATDKILAISMAEQMLRYIDNIIRNDRPYTDILLGTDAEINGPISHWLQHQTQNGGNIFITSSEQNHDVLTIPANEIYNWQTINRYERHAGVLTMPGFLLKYQTDRSRANRFHNAFLCQSFQAPEGGIPTAEDSCNDEPDLQERCGCKYCHAMLEPDAAHWGRWAEAGMMAMNEDKFPVFDQNCAEGRNNAICRLFYLQPNEAGDVDSKLQDYIGTLYPYVFTDTESQDNITQGPRKLAQKAIDRGDFAECTVKKLWNYFMKRPPLDSEADLMSALANDFAGDNYNFRNLVKRIITRDEYIQSERFGMEDPS
ncbi:MAG: DUF1585 domain-containing protein [Deltaproteobacteria bacterium]|jgi:hypothetical protein|nr:DUF1585 domain-containing protein [Deltaproteobacteria bacterium]MBT6489108.1 DUF1585 domain-containing protein [Deltaproteobacteria bacterium]